jgi:hypothetical protein
MLLVSPAAAVAASVSLEDDLLRFEAAPGEQNTVLVTVSPADPAWLRVNATPQPLPGPGCQLHSFEDPQGPGYELVECRLEHAVRRTRAAITLGDRNDLGQLDAPLDGTITGGSGRDGVFATGTHDSSVRLYGDSGDDHLSAGRSRKTVARGGRGDDELSGSGRLYGGPGDDSFSSYDAQSVMVLGPGQDRVVSAVADGRRDIIRARDGGFDTIDCVPGDRLDRLFVDALDWSRGCTPHQIARSAAPRALPLRFSADPRIRQGPGLFVTVGCPVDAARRCRGSLAARAAGNSRGSRSFAIAKGETRVVRVGRMPYCAVRALEAARLAVHTAPGGLLAARSLALSRHDPPSPVDRLRLPDGKRLLLTLQPVPDQETTMAVIRRYAGCKLDAAFGAHGVIGLLWRETIIPPQPNTMYPPGWGRFVRLIRLPGGRVVLGGTHLDYAVHLLCCPSSFGLAAITPDGAVDHDFGDNGFAEARFPEQATGGWVDANAFYTEQDPSGRTTLVMEGTLRGPESPRAAYARFTANGELIDARLDSPR